VVQKQRNSFRMKLNGSYVERHTFPQFAAGVLDPATARCVKTKTGSLLLADGLWKYGQDKAVVGGVVVVCVDFWFQQPQAALHL
jgi:hypothetical protein